MKILSLYLLLYKLSNNYFRSQYFFLQIITGIIFAFFYLLEYIFIFFFHKNYLYMLIIHRALIIKKNKIFNKQSFFWKKNINIKKKNINIKKENKYIKFFNKLYYHRRMYWGFTVVYIHIFLRKIRESKNYIIHLINTRIIWGYKVLKWRIRVYSFLYFFWYNYRLFASNRRFRKKLKKIIMFIIPIALYIKIKIKIKINFFLENLKKILKKKWR
jgi:hypothetical protein